MSITNRSAQAVKLARWRMKKKATQLVKVAAAVAVVLLIGVGVFKSWIPTFGPVDAGPTELTAYERGTLIEKVDFQCFAASTSVFTVSAYNPGWNWGPLRGGQAYAVFDVVGDLDLCIWAENYTVNYDKQKDVLSIDVVRVDARRPRIDFNPRELGGTVYQTLGLASLSKEKLANANIDRVMWEATRNMFSGDDSTYIDEMQDQLLLFAANSLVDSTCFDEAMAVMKQGVLRHFEQQAVIVGIENVAVSMPRGVDLPPKVQLFDAGQVELSVVGGEDCYVGTWPSIG